MMNGILILQCSLSLSPSLTLKLVYFYFSSSGTQWSVLYGGSLTAYPPSLTPSVCSGICIVDQVAWPDPNPQPLIPNL